jgi:hypothetical protein
LLIHILAPRTDAGTTEPAATTTQPEVIGRKAEDKTEE